MHIVKRSAKSDHKRRLVRTPFSLIVCPHNTITSNYSTQLSRQMLYLALKSSETIYQPGCSRNR